MLEKRRSSRSIVLPSRRLHSKAFGGSGWNPTIEEAIYYVYLPPKGLREEQFRVHLRIIRWHWRVVGLELPEDLKERLARELIKLTQDRINPVQ